MYCIFGAPQHKRQQQHDLRVTTHIFLPHLQLALVFVPGTFLRVLYNIHHSFLKRVGRKKKNTEQDQPAVVQQQQQQQQQQAAAAAEAEAAAAVEAEAAEGAESTRTSTYTAFISV